jgi:hypothetical protein
MNNKPNRKEILRSGYMTVGDLKKFIKENRIPDDALILYQRIEDVYFKKYGWDKSICTVVKPSYDFRGETDTFVTAWSPVKYKGDDNVYVTAHY